MKRFFILIFFIGLFQSCDDGDIIVTTFNFSDTELKTCGNLGNYVFYKVNPEALESLSLKLGTTDSIYKLAEQKVYNLNGITNFVNYRNYDGPLGNDYFCSSIPPTSPNVTVDYVAASGTAYVTVTFVLEDNDGVPRKFEFNGDGDTIPDYYEGEDRHRNPRKNITNTAVSNSKQVDLYRSQNYNIKKSVQITLKNLVLTNGTDQITIETLNMGTIENVRIDEVTGTSPFL